MHETGESLEQPGRPEWHGKALYLQLSDRQDLPQGQDGHAHPGAGTGRHCQKGIHHRRQPPKVPHSQENQKAHQSQGKHLNEHV